MDSRKKVRKVRANEGDEKGRKKGRRERKSG